MSEDALPSPKRRRQAKRPDESVVYDIPPVESKTTTWRGRLGFACLNTVLRAMKPEPVFCSRTCRIDTILKNGLDFAKNLGKRNALDLLELVKWNEKNKHICSIRFMRVSSEMFPFASHKVYGYSLDYAAAELKAVGDLANSLGHRLTSHPGQFTQLGSPKEDVVAASVRELKYHVSMFELMGIGRDGVIIIHMGGMYGDKQVTLERFKSNYQRLPQDIKDRLVLENDEMCYNVDDLLPVCEELMIPIVFDYHHDWIYPSSEPPERLLPRINATWQTKGIRPKQHLSSPRPGALTVMQRRAHAARCPELPAALDVEDAGWWRAADGSVQYVDLMVEAKDKEQAVFELHRMYALADVVLENLRPARPDPGFAGEARDGAASPRKRRSRRKGAPAHRRNLSCNVR
ncbi:UV-endonuclease UvdE-domain-containing protein [Vararia minispora EC-137]|uniref:UV-endonuclease UvdE-domain-containing protein n=1 Tax=Vararia minispora EC-137 TaxID=1314806 RepID=A0ACB8QEB3_9AGAM|nr:UV-endonuclease UvdE-domain-containing protein [Vararia minispora EC-137]